MRYADNSGLMTEFVGTYYTTKDDSGLAYLLDEHEEYMIPSCEFIENCSNQKAVDWVKNNTHITDVVVARA